MFSFDNVIDDITGNGIFQILLVLFVSCISCPSCFTITASVFIGGMPDSRCRIEPYDNSTIFPNATSDQINEMFIPFNELTKKPDRCLKYLYNVTCSDTQDLTCLFGSNDTNTVKTVVNCYAGYIYDRSSYQETIVTEWDLVCDKMTSSFASSSLFYLGVLFASLYGGFVSDRIGRMTVYRASTILALVVGVSISFSPNIQTYTALRLIMALVYFPSVVSGFVYVIEISPKRWRTPVGMMFNAIFGLGTMIFSLLAMTWRDWRALQLAKTITGFGPFFLLSWFIPESPRLQFAKNKWRQARRTCEMMAKRNKTVLSDDVWRRTEEDFAESEKKENKEGNSLKEIFSRPCSRFLIVSNMFVWMVTSLVYYGLLLNAGSLPGSVYFNNMMGGLMEFLACILGIVIVKRFGFTKCTSSSLYIASFACLLSTVCIQLGDGNEPFQTIGTVLAMVGRFGASMSFGVIYVHTVEMFPTVGRGTALGLSSMAARIGSTFSPFTVQLQLTIPWLTPTIFGVLAFLAACLAGTFPETKGKQLMMSFDDAEGNFSKHFHGKFVSRLCFLPTIRRLPNDSPSSKKLMNDEESNQN